MTMLDFRGYELQVGDIAITGALDELAFDWVRIVQFVPREDDTGISVAIALLAELTQPHPRRWYVDASQLIWHSSDYRDLLDHQIAAVFAGV